MKSLALGLIEVMGYTAAIEAADAAVKSADVTLTSVTKVQGGLVTVLLRGEVAPVQAAVDSASAAVIKMGATLLSAHVIPRPSEQVDAMIRQDATTSLQKEELSVASKNVPKKETKVQVALEKGTEEEKTPLQKTEAVDSSSEKMQAALSRAQKSKASEFFEEKAQTVEFSAKETPVQEDASVQQSKKESAAKSPSEKKSPSKQETQSSSANKQEPKKKKASKNNRKIKLPQQIPVPSQENLAIMTVSNLRKLVRLLHLPGLDNTTIKFARKDFLLEKIYEYKTNKEGKEE